VTTATRPAEQIVILGPISWETYERLLAEQGEINGKRFTYDQGTLEIMVLSTRHERLNRTLALLVELAAEALNLDLERFGSATFQRADLLKGFEPDSCFYIQHAEAVRGKEQVDLMVDPPPDLLIEIDITSPSLNRFPIFAAVGVPEVWRYDGERITFYHLVDAVYLPTTHSIALPLLSSEGGTRLLDESETLRSTAWLRHVRDWLRARAAGK
jgi:Uma2 family endonuclease